RFRADPSVLEIAQRGLAIALGRRAHASPARRFDHKALTGGNELEAFALEDLAGRERDGTICTVVSAIAAARRIIDAVKAGEKLEWLPDIALDFYDLAQPTAGATGPAGIRAELLFPEQKRRNLLGKFDRGSFDS